MIKMRRRKWRRKMHLKFFGWCIVGGIESSFFGESEI